MVTSKTWPCFLVPCKKLLVQCTTLHINYTFGFSNNVIGLDFIIFIIVHLAQKKEQRKFIQKYWANCVLGKKINNFGKYLLRMLKNNKITTILYFHHIDIAFFLFKGRTNFFLSLKIHIYFPWMSIKIYKRCVQNFNFLLHF